MAFLYGSVWICSPHKSRRKEKLTGICMRRKRMGLQWLQPAWPVQSVGLKRSKKRCGGQKNAGNIGPEKRFVPGRLQPAISRPQNAVKGCGQRLQKASLHSGKILLDLGDVGNVHQNAHQRGDSSDDLNGFLIHLSFPFSCRPENPDRKEDGSKKAGRQDDSAGCDPALLQPPRNTGTFSQTIAPGRSSETAVPEPSVPSEGAGRTP